VFFWGQILTFFNLKEQDFGTYKDFFVEKWPLFALFWEKNNDLPDFNNRLQHVIKM
jgi:hypothetical protein